jgi:hypothetical protein
MENCHMDLKDLTYYAFYIAENRRFWDGEWHGQTLNRINA